VLLVDDEPLVLRVVSRVLTFRGHPVTTAESAFEAVARARNRHDIGLLDIEMEQPTSGLRLAEQLLRRGRVSLVVFHTASQDVRVLREAASLGAVVDKGAAFTGRWWVNDSPDS
jgi:CheY-like chemotaxis protein